MPTNHFSIVSSKLDQLRDHVLNNKSNYRRLVIGSLSQDVIAEKDWNQPRNYSLSDISDDYIYDFEVMLQNETNGVIKLIAYYDSGDYIGWHTNSNVSGYNLILTYSQTNQSYFETVNGKVFDIVGWSYKTNQFDEDLYWHRAVALGDRITISLLFDSEHERTNAIERIKRL